MAESMSVDRAIRMGTLVVTLPVMALMFMPACAVYLVRGNVPSMGLFLAVGIVLAWLWWSLAVPRWRLWAYERVTDIPQLKARAVAVGLTWPDDSPFRRTEIRSGTMKAREEAFERAIRQAEHTEWPGPAPGLKDDE